jgi:hypothetical protein
MSGVLNYIATNFLASIPLISLGIADFSSHFPPKSKNFVTRISQKSASRKKPNRIPAKAGPPTKADPVLAKAGPLDSFFRRSTSHSIHFAKPSTPPGSCSTAPKPQRQAPSPGPYSRAALPPTARSPRAPPQPPPTSPGPGPPRPPCSGPSRAWL